MELNLFFEGVDSCNGFQSKLLDKINNEIPINSCILTYKGDMSAEQFGDYVTVVDYDKCEHNRYEEICDMNDLLPLGRDILEKMVPYESTAMEMLVRNFERHIYTFDESKRFYLRHLRFWNHQIVTRKINYICFSNIPHHTHDYVIYALGKVYGIPMSFCSDTSIPPRLSTCFDMENMWHFTYEKYLKYRELPEESIVLPKDLEHYYRALLYENKGLDDSAVHRGWSKSHHIAVRREFFMQDFKMKNIMHRRFSWVKHGLRVSIQNHSDEEWRKAWKKVREDKVYVKRGRIKLKSMREVSYYNGLSSLPDYENDKYVVFFLHLQPEATTLPKGGVFCSQELMIQCLATALEKFGIKLYVKEHFVQPYRNKSFYDDLAEIRNVKLIRTEIDSKDLIKHSLATASCNGTVLLESMFNGIPTFIFGDTPFRNGPGVFYVNEPDDVANYMNIIMSGKFVHDRKAVRAELMAFGESSFPGYFSAGDYDKEGKISFEEGLNGFADYAVSSIRRQLL